MKYWLCTMTWKFLENSMTCESIKILITWFHLYGISAAEKSIETNSSDCLGIEWMRLLLETEYAYKITKMFFYKKKICLILYANIFCLCTLSMAGSQGGQKRVLDLLKAIMHGCKPPWGFWESNSGSLQKLQVFWTAESSFQPPKDLLILFYVFEHFQFIQMYHVSQVPMEAIRGRQTPETGVMDGFESPYQH